MLLSITTDCAHIRNVSIDRQLEEQTIHFISLQISPLKVLQIYSEALQHIEPQAAFPIETLGQYPYKK